VGITPCSGKGTLGETLRGVLRSPNGAGGTQETNVVGIILCVNALQSQIQDKGLKAVLPLGYDTGPSSKPGPDPDAYSSVSGTILHEMVHFQDWNQCKYPPTQPMRIHARKLTWNTAKQTKTKRSW
jgi:hypothetical protein